MPSTIPDVQLVRCPACGTTNRVRAEQRAVPQAGMRKVQTPLPVPTAPLTITDATFATDVEQSPLPVLLDMWAPWCGPCRVVAPVIEELAGLAGRVRVAKMNVDENQATAERFAVRSIPTLLIFKDGREVDRIVGVRPKSEIVRHLQAVASVTA